MIRIAIHTLEEGVHEFDFEPAPEEIEVDPAMFSNIRLHVRLEHFGERILASFTVRADAALVCDRTLRNFTQPVEGSYTILFAPPSAEQGEEALEEDVRVLFSSDQEIDLTDAVRDTLLLSVPVRRVAPEAEDLEIPLRFGDPPGEEGSIDPRWEALRKLRSEEEDRS